MSLLSEIKSRRMLAMKAKKTVEKEILGVALGEIQTAAARAGIDEPEEAEIQAILKKLVKSNREALALSSEGDAKAALEEEITILETLLPKTLSPEAIAEALSGVAAQIKAAPSDGPAMGLAMKTLKQAGLAVEAADVTQAVSKLRS